MNNNVLKISHYIDLDHATLLPDFRPYDITEIIKMNSKHENGARPCTHEIEHFVSEKRYHELMKSEVFKTIKK